MGRLPVRGRKAGKLALAWAAIRRRLPDVEQSLRALLWKDRLGFELRARPPGMVAPIAPRPAATGNLSLRPPRSSSVGVLAGASSSDDGTFLAQCADFYGLPAVQERATSGKRLMERAVGEGWPLIGLSLSGLGELREEVPRLVQAFLRGGGTVLLTGITPASSATLSGIGQGLSMQLPECRDLPVPGPATFAAGRMDFAQEFAGTRIEGSETRAFFASESGTALASIIHDGQSYPAVVELPVMGGRLILSTGAVKAGAPLRDVYGPPQSLIVLPRMMILRQLYAEAAWRVPFPLADFIIDDPILRHGLMGLDYRLALARASESNFHLTVATVPRDLNLAEADVVRLLADHRSRLSACYHGNNHDGYEFYLPRAKRLLWRSRPLARQERALTQAVQRAQRFSRRTGYTLDRVMVFPHGIGPFQLFPKLAELGFLATCNADDRYPLEAPPPQEPDVGMRPADLAWAGFPLIWRRRLSDRCFAFDAFAGRPIIGFAHRSEVGSALLPFVERAGEVNAITNGTVRWCGLEEIARHCYLERRDLQKGWQVQMLGNEICLHNPDNVQRVYHVRREHRDAGTALAARGTSSRDEEIEIAVEPAGSTLIRRARSGSLVPDEARSCLLVHPPGA